MELKTLQNVSQGVGYTLLAYGASRYTRVLNLDSCTSYNVYLGLTSIAISGLTLVARQLV